jgi:hypothetical protein
MSLHDNHDHKWVTNNDLQLELKALRSDVKVWLLGAVALNQFLASVDLPSSITAAAFLGLIGKGLMAAILRG